MLGAGFNFHQLFQKLLVMGGEGEGEGKGALQLRLLFS